MTCKSPTSELWRGELQVDMSYRITKHFRDKKLSRISRILECRKKSFREFLRCSSQSRMPSPSFAKHFFREMLLRDVSRKFLVTVEPPNNESIGIANFVFIVWGFSLLRGTHLLKSICKWCIGKIHYEGFSLFGEFIIGGSTVYVYMNLLTDLECLKGVID